MRRWFAFGILLLAFITMAPVFTAEAEEVITIPPATYQFGQSILLQADLQTSKPIQYALVYFNEQGNARTNVKPAVITTANGLNYQLEYQLDLNEQPFRAFSKVEYHFEVGFPSKQIITSPTGHLDYIDDRFDWQNKQEGLFIVHWYEGDISFAQKTLDAAQIGLQRIKTFLRITGADPIEIYIYPNAEDMQETLLLAQSDWIAGHTDPDLGVIMVTLPSGPEQQLLTEQRIPHELMHVLLYRSLGAGYNNLPTWLNEGLASLAELFPNPDYEVLLDSAFQKGKLIPMTYLCKNFPHEASGTLLAYAQSASFASYLYTRFGEDGLQDLLNQYKNEVNCEDGVQNALGVGLTRLDQQWRQARFGENANRIAFSKLLPWIALMIAVLAAPIGMIIAWLRRRPSQSRQAPSND
jgi:hypothetical protein